MPPVWRVGGSDHAARLQGMPAMWLDPACGMEETMTQLVTIISIINLTVATLVLVIGMWCDL